jgi:hypothetical protein
MLCVVALLSVSCGGSDPAPTATPDPDAAARAFLVDRLERFSKGQFGPDWDVLHPAQQALVDRDHYIACSQAAGIPDFSVRAIESYHEPIEVPGTGLRPDSVAVTVELTAQDGTKSTLTPHAVDVDGGWRWIIGDPAAYAGGACPQ